MEKHLYSIELPLEKKNQKIRDFISIYRRKTKLDYINTLTLHDFFEILKTEKKLSQNSIRYYYFCCKKLVRNHYDFSENNLRAKKQFSDFFGSYKIKQIHPFNNPTSIFSTDEVFDFYKISSKKNHLIALTLYFSGLRIHELIQIEIRNCFIDREDNLVLIKIKNAKLNKQRDVVIPLDLFFGIRKEFEGRIYLFESRKNIQLKRNSIETFFYRLSKKINKRITPHLLRRSFITNHLNLNTDIKTLSIFSGTKPETILTHYMHPRIDNLKFINTLTEGTKYGKQKISISI
jgi:integrase